MVDVIGMLVLVTAGVIIFDVILEPGAFEQPGSIVKHMPMSRMSLAFPILTFEHLGGLMMVLMIIMQVGASI